MIMECVARLAERGVVPDYSAVADHIAAHWPHLPEIKANCLLQRVVELMDRMVRHHMKGKPRRTDHGRSSGNDAKRARKLLAGLVPGDPVGSSSSSLPPPAEGSPMVAAVASDLETPMAPVPPPTGARTQAPDRSATPSDSVPPTIYGPFGEPLN